MGGFQLLSCVIPSKKRSNKEKGLEKLYLNVYDVTPANNYLYWFGLGIHHSGIEAYGVEYAFGLDDKSSSGVFEVKPRRCPGFIFRRSIPLGRIDMSRSEFSSFMESLSKRYNADTYHLFSKNCNHFTDEACQRLIGKSIPGWVNRLARVGCFVESLLPECDQAKSIGHLPANQTYPEDGEDSDAAPCVIGKHDSEKEHLLRK